jgi:hypothetical protein
MKVKFSESECAIMRQKITRIISSLDPIINQVNELSVKPKSLTTIIMSIKQFADKYGSKDMMTQSSTLHYTCYSLHAELYSLTDRLITLRNTHKDIISIFNKYEKSCKK